MGPFRWLIAWPLVVSCEARVSPASTGDTQADEVTPDDTEDRTTPPGVTTDTANDDTGAPKGPCPPGEALGAFEEVDGLLLIEAENSTAIGNGWHDVDADGVTYLEAQNDHLGNTNGDERLFELAIATPGLYRFHMKSVFTGNSSTDRNDSWFRLENADDVHYFASDGRLDSTAAFEALRDGKANTPAIYYPGGNALDRPDFGEENPGRNGYFKLYRSGNGPNEWHGRTIDNHGYIVYAYFENPGTYELSLKERSEGHRIDRFAFVHVEQVSSRIPEEELDGPESERRCEPQ
ncbi:MAG: hypothetical protein AAGA48_27925 [Myxococcota bacterium]